MIAFLLFKPELRFKDGSPKKHISGFSNIYSAEDK
jgi:hypothetical protein